MKETNVGVIGVGAMGYNHVRIYSELENANYDEDHAQLNIFYNPEDLGEH